MILVLGWVSYASIIDQKRGSELYQTLNLNISVRSQPILKIRYVWISTRWALKDAHVGFFPNCIISEKTSMKDFTVSETSLWNDTWTTKIIQSTYNIIWW